MGKLVSELEGRELDFWVARSLGANVEEFAYDERWRLVPNRSFPGLEGWELSFCRLHMSLATMDGPDYSFHPSANWSDGGPILESENITVIEGAFGVPHTACSDYSRDPECNDWIDGKTYLEAGMRAVVMSHFGKKVPDEPT